MRRLLLTALLALATGCTQGSVDVPAKPVPLDAQLDPVPNPHGNTDQIDPLPDPEAQGGSVGRAPRRLTVAQLKESIRVAVGMEWDELEARAQSLGRADYALITSENTEPNLVFARFLDDGARKVCIAQAQKDIAQADLSLRTLGRTLPTPMSDLTKLTDAQVNETLVYLSTRFWGAPLAGEELTRYATFFRKASARAETLKKRDQALAVVCIAMLTDSRFITY
ncbi:hypothetical protein HRD49_01660 [Corallococcus exiguus]|uniref:hypothetical protein n=1 Tax=Corallococcus TaxID=83461 RepID=UPI000EA37ABB|nr:MULTISPECIES: hypothetical protein [Corallococcus]NNC14513.1 hypothetical protein [Corallococcus exiguus]NRD52853.1 hypothetical protein [Corallococcus exiguus]NRD60443.1 hypothetical protein [Corallococcus exiguus]RKH31108.1 hypothetical protein D7V77_01110 [Corallococcus sp. CA041A]RKI19516.1 hypothetical protein D7Y15_04205 [Corallococcus sp. AB030]